MNPFQFLSNIRKRRLDRIRISPAATDIILAFAMREPHNAEAIASSIRNALDANFRGLPNSLTALNWLLPNHRCKQWHIAKSRLDVNVLHDQYEIRHGKFALRNDAIPAVYATTLEGRYLHDIIDTGILRSPLKIAPGCVSFEYGRIVLDVFRDGRTLGDLTDALHALQKPETSIPVFL